jgi:carboxypeptidase T
MARFLFTLMIALTPMLGQADDYKKILNRLQELSQHPDTSLFTLGKNDQGRDIVGIVLGNPARAVTKHLVVGTHHGNERAAAQVPLHFIEQILRLKDKTSLYYVIPVLNISGYNSSRRHELGADGHQHDPNRDYEDACLVKNDFKLSSTNLLAEFIERENIVAAVSVHGYVGTFTFPWGTTVQDYRTQDDAYMEAWARQAVKVNKYKVGTHGAAIYPAAGAFEDWAYYKLGVWSYLLEIKSPLSDLRKDAASLVEFFKHAPNERSRNLGQPVNCVERILAGGNRSRP